MLLILGLSGIRNQQVSGSSPLAGFSLCCNDLGHLLGVALFLPKTNQGNDLGIVQQVGTVAVKSTQTEQLVATMTDAY